MAVRIEGEAIPSNQVFQMFHEDSAADGTMPPGFRMVGSPFDFPVDWANVQIGFQGQVFSLDQAINNNPPLVSPIIYTFIQQGGYRFDVAPEGQLLPFTGHWIRLLQPAQIFIPPSRGGLRSVANSKGERRKAKGEIQWRLQLAASVGDSVTSMSSDVYNYVGASSAAEDGEDRWDAPKAPTPPGSRVLLNIVRSPNGTAGNGTAGNGTESVPYAQDLRKGPFTKKQVFDLEVVADAPNVEVRLTWPNVQEVPKNYAVILRDLETQKQVYLRTSGGYTYNSGAGGARRLQIVVDPSGSKPLQVTVRAAKAQMGAGALFTYALSQEADVEAVVISPTGQLLRRFNARSAPVGVHTLSWDGKDSRGRALGRGVYLLRVRAQTPESQVSQGVATFMMR